MSLLVTLATETEALAPLILPAIVFAGIAVGIFILLGFVTWSFRDVANRHSNKTATSGDAHHGAGH
ncbi:MAG: hypothetical protein KF761_11280 [Salinibacterium sp.]|nr:hypothetical protein [Salinibacterium sp.]